MATLAGHRATGWQNDIGSLEPGMKADLILVNTDRPEWVPTYNYVYSLVYTASGDSVDTTIVDGRILMENRQLTTLDLTEVHTRCRELAPKSRHAPTSNRNPDGRCYEFVVKWRRQRRSRFAVRGPQAWRLQR